MTTENANPSISTDPASNDSLAGVFAFVFKKMMQSVSGVTPAKVISFQSGPPDYVRVQPQIQIVDTNKVAQSRGQIAEVPVCPIGAGGMLLRFNLKEGDTGLLFACDRDISLFMQSGNESPPNTDRIKDFSSSFFLPLVMRDYTINGEDAENAVLQTADGSIRIAIFPDKIKATGPFEFDGPVTMNETLTITGRTIIHGDLNTGANITAAGTIMQGIPIPP